MFVSFPVRRNIQVENGWSLTQFFFTIFPSSQCIFPVSGQKNIPNSSAAIFPRTWQHRSSGSTARKVLFHGFRPKLKKSLKHKYISDHCGKTLMSYSSTVVYFRYKTNWLLYILNIFEDLDRKTCTARRRK